MHVERPKSIHVTCINMHVISGLLCACNMHMIPHRELSYLYVGTWMHVLKNESQSHGLCTICVQMFVDVYVFCEYPEDLSDFIFAKP